MYSQLLENTGVDKEKSVIFQLGLTLVAVSLLIPPEKIVKCPSKEYLDQILKLYNYYRRNSEFVRLIHLSKLINTFQ